MELTIKELCALVAKIRDSYKAKEVPVSISLPNIDTFCDMLMNDVFLALFEKSVFAPNTRREAQEAAKLYLSSLWTEIHRQANPKAEKTQVATKLTCDLDAFLAVLDWCRRTKDVSAQNRSSRGDFTLAAEVAQQAVRDYIGSPQ
jgi:hypothetical protein